MSVRVLPTIKRFFEGTANVVFAPSGGEHDQRGTKDFMSQDLTGSARFYDWIKEARDWCVSRQRYWGIPIPVWVCPKCDAYRVIGTIAELEERSGKPLADPHRPYVDDVTIPCTCGGTMKRVGDIYFTSLTPPARGGRFRGTLRQERRQGVGRPRAEIRGPSGRRGCCRSRVRRA